MASTEHYDLLVLGSGEAGKVLAWKYGAAQNKKCGVIERSMLGGSCPNVACMPSKNVLWSAKMAHAMAQGNQYGLLQNSEGARMDVVKQRKDLMVHNMADEHRAAFNNSKVDLIWGEGNFIGPKEIEVNEEFGKKVLTADKIVICTGSRALIPDVPGLAESKPLTHVELLNLAELPTHLIILGAGYVALEFAQAMVRLGSRVTVIGRGPRILKNEDEESSRLLQEVLEKEGVKFLLNTSVAKVSGHPGSVTITGSHHGEDISIDGSHILCATGREPNTRGIGLEKAGVKTNAKGHIVVDEHSQASKDGSIFAVGDCAGSPYFTHMGYDDYRILRDVLAGKDLPPHRRSDRQVPFTLFTDPELAHVGLREHEAKAKGIEYRLAKVPMGVFLRTLTMGEGSTIGFAKALVATDSDQILGFAALGPGAGELLPVVQLAMKKKLPFTDIADLIISHPTMNEGLVALFESLL